MVHLLGNQGLALRDHQESSNTSHSQSNFLTLVHKIAHCYTLQKNYLEHSLLKDVKYLEPKSQNELIKKLIQRIIIIEETIEAGVHSISADEVTTCNDEILSICLRYVNSDNKIYIGFFFFYFLGFLSRTFMNHRTAEEGGGHYFNSSRPLPPASQTFRH